ncbi:MAG: hypothetical protein HQ542_10765 [Bacteroidia bacterium]|nr:hypothetical protein [Bacteroidia bacterium]
MLIYRFKITSEEHEEFSREICIQPGQKFIDLYQCILESAELIPGEQASFYMTDKRYKRDKEISLNLIEKQVKRYDPELDEMVTITLVPKLMKDSKLKDLIEDPHQRMIFEYHGREYFAFLIELVKIMRSDHEGPYPKCVKWIGELPKKPETLIVETKEEETLHQLDPLKSVIPELDIMAKLDSIEENEAELADIENKLGEILFGGIEEQSYPQPSDQKLKKKVPEVHDESDALFEDDKVEDEDEKEDFSEGMEHLEDYDNIENIEIKYSKFNDDSDDD